MPINPTRNEHIFRLYGIKHSRAFFKLVQQTLMLPDYFGGNWNAPDDCMRDLSWLPDKKSRPHSKVCQTSPNRCVHKLQAVWNYGGHIGTHKTAKPS